MFSINFFFKCRNFLTDGRQPQTTGGSRRQPWRNDLENPTNTQSLFKKEKNKKKKTTKQLKQQREGAADVQVDDAIVTGRNDDDGGEPVGLSQKLGFFLEAYQTANNIHLSSLELESFTDKCMVDLSEGVGVDVNTLGNQVKAAFAVSWKEMMCDNSLVDGEINPGSPVVLVIAASAIRVLELLRGFKSFTRECRVAKLFSRHIKVEEQVTLLKNRVNIAGGTPSRIKKLIDMEALGLSRLSLVLLDIRPDVVEFWDLYKIYFHDRVVEGSLRICLYGPLPSSKSKVKSGSRNEWTRCHATGITSFVLTDSLPPRFSVLIGSSPEAERFLKKFGGMSPLAWTNLLIIGRVILSIGLNALLHLAEVMQISTRRSDLPALYFEDFFLSTWKDVQEI